MADDFEHVASMPFNDWQDGAVRAESIRANEVCNFSDDNIIIIIVVVVLGLRSAAVRILTEEVRETATHNAHICLWYLSPLLFKLEIIPANDLVRRL